jgi:hypothetical protein
MRHWICSAIAFALLSCSSSSDLKSLFPHDQRVKVSVENTSRTFSQLQGKVKEETEKSEHYVQLTQDKFDDCFPPSEGGKEICLYYRITEWSKNRFLAKLPQSNAKFIQVCDVERNSLNCYTVTTFQDGYERAILDPSKFSEYISATTIYKVR